MLNLQNKFAEKRLIRVTCRINSKIHLVLKVTDKVHKNIFYRASAQHHAMQMHCL